MYSISTDFKHQCRWFLCRYLHYTTMYTIIYDQCLMYNFVLSPNRSLEYTIHDHELRDTRKKLDEVWTTITFCTVKVNINFIENNLLQFQVGYVYTCFRYFGKNILFWDKFVFVNLHLHDFIIWYVHKFNCYEFIT